MANAYKCDFCGALTEGKSDSLRTKIFGANQGQYYQSEFLGSLTVAFTPHRAVGEKALAEVCPPCIRKFAQRIAEGK